jgi:biotin carboxylase
VSADPIVAIVDPLSTGKYLAPEFGRRGWRSVAVLSRATLPTFFTAGLKADDFLCVLGPDRDLEPIVDQLRAKRVSAVVPGTETGVELADLLAERLDLVGNGTALSAHRRDKVLMMRALDNKGIRTAQTEAFRDADALIAWADARRIWPLVVKPRRSAGTDSVYFCEDHAAARAAVAHIVGTTSRLGEPNDSVCAQQLLTGDQYFVNTVSVDGRHALCEIWRDRKRPAPGRSMIYDIEELVPWGSSVLVQLVAYVHDVLSALHVTHGPAHTEVMWTADGPVLVELNARMQGSIILEPVTAALGHNHVMRTVDAITDLPAFLSTVDMPYVARRYLRAVSLIAPIDGVVSNGDLLSAAQLPSFAGVMGDVRTGRSVQRTVDLYTSPGCVYLLAETPQEIERDTARIRELERDGLYAAVTLG